MYHLILQIIQSFLTMYNAIVIIDIIVSWFPQLRHSPIGNILDRMVLPYFALFRNLPYAQAGMFDLAPIYGLIFIELLQVMVQRLQQYASVTLGFVCAFLLTSIWSFFCWMLGFFAILAGIRLIVMLCTGRSKNSLGHLLDMFLAFPCLCVMRLFSGKHAIDYRLLLLLVIVINVATIFLGTSAVQYLAGALERLPI